MTVNATTGGAAVQDAAAIKTAAASGVSHLLIVRTETLGADKAGAPTAMSETVSRLLDVSTGKEIERDIVWRVLSLSGDGSKFEAEFVNGVRVK